MQSKASTNGSKFGAATTAEEVIAGMNLSGKLAIITGGSGGLGKETARVLALAGAHVFLGARSEQALITAKHELSDQMPQAKVSIHPLDLMSIASVRAFADAVGSLRRPVDLLICNAGIMACPLAYSSIGVESQLMTNYVGHAALTSFLSAQLREAEGARLISLTSLAHQYSSVMLEDLNYRRRPYEKWQAYGQSKTASSLLAVYAHQRMHGAGVTALAVHPGVIATELGRFLSQDEIAAVLASMGDASGSSVLKSVGAGAATTVWAATAPELTGAGPLYLEDCHVAETIEEPNPQFGVFRHALDTELAERLWRTTEDLLGQRLAL